MAVSRIGRCAIPACDLWWLIRETARRYGQIRAATSKHIAGKINIVDIFFRMHPGSRTLTVTGYDVIHQRNIMGCRRDLYLTGTVLARITADITVSNQTAVYLGRFRRLPNQKAGRSIVLHGAVFYEIITVPRADRHASIVALKGTMAHGDMIRTHTEEESAFLIAGRAAILEQYPGAASTRMQTIAGVLIELALFYHDIPTHLEA